MHLQDHLPLPDIPILQDTRLKGARFLTGLRTIIVEAVQELAGVHQHIQEARLLSAAAHLITQETLIQGIIHPTLGALLPELLEK
jgi:hypothetical protein